MAEENYNTGFDLSGTPWAIRLEANKPTLLDLVQKVNNNVTINNLRAVSVGTINAFYPETQSADITLNNAVRSETNGIISPSTIYNVPVVVNQGGGSFMSFPIRKDDQCLVLFCDFDNSYWKLYGAKDQPPATDRMHDINDAIAIVGVNPAVKELAIGGYDPDNVNIMSSAGLISQSVKDTEINAFGQIKETGAGITINGLGQSVDIKNSQYTLLGIITELMTFLKSKFTTGSDPATLQAIQDKFSALLAAVPQPEKEEEKK